MEELYAAGVPMLSYGSEKRRVGEGVCIGMLDDWLRFAWTYVVSKLFKHIRRGRHNMQTTYNSFSAN